MARQQLISSGVFGLLLSLSAAVTLFVEQRNAAAQIVPDATLGNEASQVTSNAEVRGLPAERIEGGATRGDNLFHSFSEFNVGELQQVYFANPNGIQNILSRVTGNDVSEILGTLGVDGSANLFFLNPNGIIFGPNARLDVAGSFVASTASSFGLGDGLEFSAVDPHAPPLLTVNVTPGLQYSPVQQGHIENAGSLSVGAGQTLSLSGHTLTHTGTLTAPGGTIELLGHDVALLDAARVDTSSSLGGGTVRIGGDLQGQGTVPTAAQTFVSPDTVIAADAIEDGNGGQVIVWADEATGFYGQISAQGAGTGNGGFVEVSGKEQLIFQGGVDTRAPNGSMGTLLLDPTNILIANGTGDAAGDGTDTFAGSNSGAVGAVLSTPLGAIDDAAPTTIYESELENLSGNTNIILQATDNITVEDLVDNQLTFQPGGGFIQLTADANGDGVGSFTMMQTDEILTNGRDITLSGADLVLGSVSTVGPAGLAGAITLNASRNINTRRLSSFSVDAPGDGVAGAIALNAGRDITIEGVADSTGNLIAIDASSEEAGNNGIGGAVTLTAGNTININGQVDAHADAADEDSIGGNMTLTAGNDINLRAALNIEEAITQTGGRVRESPAITAFDVSASNAGNDSRGGAIALNAGGNINVDITSDVNHTIHITGASADDVEINIDLTGFSAASRNPGNDSIGGAITFMAGGNIDVDMEVTAANSINAAGDLEDDAQATVDFIGFEAAARGANAEGLGGAIAFTANGTIDVDVTHTVNNRINVADDVEDDVEARANLTVFDTFARGTDINRGEGNGTGGAVIFTATDVDLAINSAVTNWIEVGDAIDGDVDVGASVTAFNASGAGANSNGKGDGAGGAIAWTAADSINVVLNSAVTNSIVAEEIDDVEATVNVSAFNTSGAGASRSGDGKGDGTGGAIAWTAVGPINVVLNSAVANSIAAEEIDDIDLGVVINAFNASLNGSEGSAVGGTITFVTESDINAVINSAVEVMEQSLEDIALNVEVLAFNASSTRAEEDSQGGTINLDADGTIAIDVDNAEVRVGELLIDKQDSPAPITILETALTTASDENEKKPGQNSLAGDLSLIAAGDIVVNGRVLALADEAGADSIAGDIEFQAGDDIAVTGIIRTDSEDATERGIGGDVRLTAGGNITILGEILSLVEEIGEGGAAGNVFLTAGGDISTGNILASADSDVSPGAGKIGDGGDVRLVSQAGTVTLNNAQINANALGNGTGGEIQIDARSVLLTGNTSLTTTAAGTGNAGNIFVRVDDSVLLDNSRLFTSLELGATGQGGDITIEADDVTLRNFSFIDTATFGAGDAGDVTIAANRISLEGGSSIFSITAGVGDAGDITLIAPDTVSLSDRSSISTAVNPNAIGSGGGVTINTGSLVMTEGSQVQALTRGDGEAGDITVNATEQVLITGVVSDAIGVSPPRQSVPVTPPTPVAEQEPNDSLGQAMPLTDDLFSLDSPETVNPNVGLSTSIPYVSIESAASDTPAFDYYTFEVTAGTRAIFDIDTNSKNPNLQITLFDAEGNLLTENDNAPAFQGAGGSVPIGGPNTPSESQDPYLRYVFNAPGTYVIQVAQLNDLEQVVGVSAGYSLQVSLETPNVAGSGTSGLASGLFAQTESAGVAGDILINTPEFILQDGAQVLASGSSSGPGGSINIVADEMSVTSGSRVAVSSPNSQAGNLTIDANTLRLNQGELSAVTGQSGSEESANITLRNLEFLILENESLISANALGDANGGNIAIAADFILAAPPQGLQGSDIIANAERGNGGRVEITTQGLFGIEFRPQRTPDNDITVSSEFGLAGVFVQNDLGIDPSRGLTPLPADPTDPSELIDRRCELAARSRPSEFVVTGRGGLPPDPAERLGEEGLMEDLGPEAVLQEGVGVQESQSAAMPRSGTAEETPDVVVEAQGWTVDEAGQLHLIAAVPANESSVLLRFTTGCSAE